MKEKNIKKLKIYLKKINFVENVAEKSNISNKNKHKLCQITTTKNC